MSSEPSVRVNEYYSSDFKVGDLVKYEMKSGDYILVLVLGQGDSDFTFKGMVVKNTLVDITEEISDEMVPRYGDISDTWSKKAYERFHGEVTLEFV